MSYTIKHAKKDLAGISIEEELVDRMLKVAVIITNYMEDNVPHQSDVPIIVGGLAMQIYTSSEYTTNDIDFVTSASIKLEKLLLELGFRKNRVYIYDRLNVAVDIVDSVIEPENHKSPNKIEIDKDNYVYSISIEDILYDRALDYGREDNKRFSIYLMTSQYEDIDFDYIQTELKKADNKALEAFIEWKSVASEDLHN